jgi:hypothetical protein
VAVFGPAGTPRTLLLALDAVPYRVVLEAVARGAFDGFRRPSALVAPFPSLTHPSFAALFEPFGVDPSWGYEIRYFDTAANRIVGGSPVTYRDQVPPWSGLFDAPHRGVVAKISNYVSAPMAAMGELDEITQAVLASERDVVIAYLGATDGFMHLYEDAGLVDFLVALDQRLGELQRRHRRLRKRPLRIVLFSDHGCGRARVHYTGSLRPMLRDAGLRPVEQLVGPLDVVAHTFGIVNYTALFLKEPTLACVAAKALAPLAAVELAAWASGPGTVEVVSGQGRARVAWRSGDGGTCYTCVDDGTDVLHLSGALERLAADDKLDADGFAHEDAWLDATARSDYPDPLRRLALALTGDRVRSRATVLVSLGAGWSWGWRSAFAGGLVRGGRLKGTHGGLDRESSLGFLLVDGTCDEPPAVVRADKALAPFADDVLRDRGCRRAG